MAFWSKENNSQEENPELCVSVGWDNVSAHIQTVLRQIFYKEESKRKLKIKNQSSDLGFSAFFSVAKISFFDEIWPYSKPARAHFTDALNIIIDLSRKLNFLGMNQGYWSCKLCDPLAKSLSSVDYLI